MGVGRQICFSHWQGFEEGWNVREGNISAPYQAHRPLQRSDLSAVRMLPFNWSQERALDIAKQWWNIKAQFRRRASAVPN